jgi:hypothetical protein
VPALQEQSTLVMDATGVGCGVDLLKAERPGCRIVPVMITAPQAKRRSLGFGWERVSRAEAGPADRLAGFV